MRSKSLGFTTQGSLAQVLGLAFAFGAGLLAGHVFWPVQQTTATAARAMNTPSPVQPTAPPQPPPPPIAKAPEPAAEKPLQEHELTLKGVFMTANSDSSMALIADDQGHQKVYRVGQKIGDYTLESVSGKEAVIAKDGVSQTLVLKKEPRTSDETLAQQATAAAAPATPAPAAAEPVPQPADQPTTSKPLEAQAEKSNPAEPP